jgi:DNA-binding transcriptional MerR regulator
MAQVVTIGRAAAATGMSRKAIRYYEQVGVLPPAGRTRAGYRQYTEQGVERLHFVRRARALGLSLRTITTLTATLDGRAAPLRPQVRRLVRAHLAAVRGRIAELLSLQRELQGVLRSMRGPRRRGPAGRCRCLDPGRGP